MPIFKLDFISKWLGVTPDDVVQAHEDIKAASGGSDQSSEGSRSNASSAPSELEFTAPNEKAPSKKVSIS